LFLVGLVLVHCDRKKEDLVEKAIQTYPSVNNVTAARELIKLMEKHIAQREARPKTAPETVVPFPCTRTGRTNPIDARRLRPADIDVVATIGDSVAAGFAALSDTIWDIFTEYRGHAFTIGGQQPYDEYVTVPNMLRLYNPAIKGFAVGDGGPDSPNAVLNVAVSGARSYDLLPQLDALESRMIELGVDMEKDWKLLSIFIGGNDLCDYCSDTAKNSPVNFARNIEATLDAIQARFPRVFVNLMTPPDVTLLGEVTSGLCELLHLFECGCSKDAPTKAAHRQYTDLLFSLVGAAKYKNKIDFKVSLQPFLANLTLPRNPDGSPDDTYFSPDCFHFSGKAHQAAAVALWNNMCEEPARKRTSWIPGEPIECPKDFIV